MAAEMGGEEVKVTSGTDGSTVTAIKLKCVECGCDEFVCLLIGPKRDLHLQCTICAECYCAHDSECHNIEEIK